MAVTPLTLISERWLDQVNLGATVLDAAAAPMVESFTLPAGLGDVAIMSVYASVIVVGTVPVTSTFPRGMRAVVLASDAASTVEHIGVGEWFATGGSAAAHDRFDVFIDPDALVLFRQGELMTIAAPEMDASTTGDLVMKIRAVRVRPMQTPGAPLRLVR